MNARYEVRKMSRAPLAARKVKKEGAYGVWDSLKDSWVLNSEYLGKNKCEAMKNALNVHWNKKNK